MNAKIFMNAKDELLLALDRFDAVIFELEKIAAMITKNKGDENKDAGLYRTISE